MPDLPTTGSVVVVAPVGQPARAYLVRSADKQIAILDTMTPALVTSRYTAHSFTGLAQDREQVKRILRVKVSGRGVIAPDDPPVPADRFPGTPSGIMTITADNTRTDTYVYSALAAEPSGGFLWVQQCLPLKGRVFDIDIVLKATGLLFVELDMEYVLVN